MVYATKKAARLTLTEFTPAMRRLHKVCRATINGVAAGWTVVMRFTREIDDPNR